MVEHIVFKEVGYTYQSGSPFEMRALHDINVAFESQKVTAIIGHTGSGKSTLLQHLNVLVRPTTGSVIIAEEEVTAQSKHTSLKALRKKVGVVFQFPEAQLFEETVLKDVMFGPMNFGVSAEEAERIAREKLQLVGIDESLFDRSPFDLSGGQMRRVAIAGVLALEPEVLVLDEPTAGLDPMGHLHMMELFMKMQREWQMTLILVTHQMEDVAKYADNVVVLEAGTVVATGTPESIFSRASWLKDKQLGIPHSARFWERLRENLAKESGVEGVFTDTTLPLDVEELAKRIVALKEGTTNVR